ncbi:flagellar export chaperone FliS [Salinimonas sp. HHU 13199]|uniref:Flagellar secretion chaperone FliS n=1 Tax=Salinimonas profundi TaxID=2729140 RepID=A0ABR8LN46_9ALTE|nr:flagellar export chaperone FliS [Salinimonas profundi]MBD3585354.1 flagellar export chaperone FliS [Salinimonas profundi]
MSLRGINAYKKGNVKQDISAADPHRLTLLLFQGALDRIAYAKGAIERNDFEAKSENISKAVSILIYLRDTLDVEVGGEIAENMYALYTYMIEKVNEALLSNNIGPLEETYALLEPIRTAWVQIPEADKQEAYARRAG